MISPVILGLYVMDIHFYSLQFELAACDGKTANLITSGQPALIVSYLESHLNHLQQLLKEGRTFINVSNSTAMFFSRVSLHFWIPRRVKIFGEPIHWVDIAR